MTKEIQDISFKLINDIVSIIGEAKSVIAISTNSTITALYWNIGYRINTEILNQKRAEYGKQIIPLISKNLTLEFGKGWSEKQIRHCLRFAETFQNKEIVYAVSRELSWTHFRTLMYIDSELSRNFYLELCRLEKWSTRTLSKKIDSLLFERTAISKKPDQQIQKELKELREDKNLSPNLIFKSSYVLDFLGLDNNFTEKNLEDAFNGN